MNKILKLMMLFLIVMIPFYKYEVKAEDIELPQEQVSKKQRQGKVIDKAGTYFFQLSIDDEESEENEYARVHIRYPKTVLNKSKEEGIDAHDIVVLTGTFQNLKQEDLIKTGGSHAWSMIDGNPIDSISIELEEPIPLTGTVARVIYKTDNGTAVEVNVFEQDHIYFIPDELYMNQYSVLDNRFRTLSILVIYIVAIPILLFLVLFRYMHRKTQNLKELLDRQ